jgi:hypothetical protein
MKMKLTNEVMHLLMRQEIDVEESSLSRVFRHQDKNSIGIISASRDKDEDGEKLTKADNRKRTDDLLTDLRNRGYEPTRLVGHFQEQDPKKKINVKEISFLIVGSDDRDLLKDLKKLGNKFKQDSILHKAKGKKAIVVGLRAGISDFTIGNFNVPKAGQEFEALSKVKGRTFIFKEGADVYNRIGSFATAQLRQAQIKAIEKGINDGKTDEEILDRLYTDVNTHYPYAIERRLEQITDIRNYLSQEV